MKNKTYEVRFTVTLPAYCLWEDAGYGDDGRAYTRIDPGASDPYICIPDDAEIEEISPVYSNGFYHHTPSNRLFHRINGIWHMWSGADQRWMSSSHSDESVYQQGDSFRELEFNA